MPRSTRKAVACLLRVDRAAIEDLYATVVRRLP